MNLQYIVVCLLSCFLVISLGEVRFTNLKCETLDPSFATFPQCDLKIIKRGVVALNIYMKLHQTPLTNVSINLAFFKKANGYHPFLYNVTADLCKYLKSRKSYPILKVFFDFARGTVNVNQSCPMVNDVIVRELVLKPFMFDKLPLPGGDYLLKLMLGAYNQWKAVAELYTNIPDKWGERL